MVMTLGIEDVWWKIRALDTEEESCVARKEKVNVDAGSDALL